LSEDFKSINPKGWANYERLYAANYLWWVVLMIFPYLQIVKCL